MISTPSFLFLTYLFAAVPFGLVVTTLFGGDEDIREAGSGNIGATNVVRVYGWRLGGPVFALDVLKGLLPVLLAAFMWPAYGENWLALVGLVAFLGHCYPVFLAFHGGKGVATGAGAMLGLTPIPTLVAAATWVVVLLLTGRSSLASLCATGGLVVAVAVLAPSLLLPACLLAVGVVHSHVGNIRRLIAGDEGAIIRPVRWGRGKEAEVEDPAALLAQAPAGPAAAPPPLWREGTPSSHPEEG